MRVITVRRLAALATAAAASAVPSAPAAADIPLPPDLELVEVATGVSNPTVVTHAGDGSGRLFIVEQPGRIRVMDDGVLLAAPYLDITSIVNSSGFEQGLLGLAFDPGYATNGDFYVYYTRGDNATVLAHYNTNPPTSNTATSSGTVLWTQPQPASNHNAGQLAFGPDGFLYMSVGDGGIQGDPSDNAQNLETWLGKILRIDVNGAAAYSVPAGNPYVGVPNTLSEIWHSGLRNPWRFSFDRATGDMFIGDVGYSSWEEINHAPASSTGGENWGWRCYEGAHPFNTTGCGPVTDYDMPILEYSHGAPSFPCSVTGGYRYRGPMAPSLDGAYLFGDYCTGEIWAGIEDQPSGSWFSILLDFPQNTTSLRTFGEDEPGNVYVAAGSTVWVLREIGSIFMDGFESGDTTAWSGASP